MEAGNRMFKSQIAEDGRGGGSKCSFPISYEQWKLSIMSYGGLSMPATGRISCSPQKTLVLGLHRVLSLILSTPGLSVSTRFLITLGNSILSLPVC